jgi:hypothetical protein
MIRFKHPSPTSLTYEIRDTEVYKRVKKQLLDGKRETVLLQLQLRIYHIEDQNVFNVVSGVVSGAIMSTQGHES